MARGRKAMQGRQVVRGLPLSGVEPQAAIDTKRRLMADFCRRVEEEFTGKRTSDHANKSLEADMAGLSPRVRQTLERLLAGDAEKQIATHLSVSRHTVHVYVKNIYRRFHVSSRGELLARFVHRSVRPPSIDAAVP